MSAQKTKSSSNGYFFVSKNLKFKRKSFFFSFKVRLQYVMTEIFSWLSHDINKTSSYILNCKNKKHFCFCSCWRRIVMINRTMIYVRYRNHQHFGFNLYHSQCLYVNMIRFSYEYFYWKKFYIKNCFGSEDSLIKKLIIA